MNLEDLKNTVSNITLYDVKSAIRKAQNVVLNYSEMEAKVREATNNEPWGASSTLMQEIANGTYSYQAFNEIMQMLYKRFTDKSAEEWRQIYKALVLLEFLVKNGSERVVDDARSHIATIKILRNFHYIDDKAKDQGINVRNRAKELADLLSDSEKIRTERRKAKQSKTKYTGVGSDESGFGGSGKKYGGFGSEDLSYGSYSGQVYGDGGGFSSAGYSGGSDFQDRPSRNAQFEEYDEYDDGGARAPVSRSSVPRKSTPKKETAPPKKTEVVDLFSFDDELPSTTRPATTSNGKGKAAESSSASAADDDFDDFQSATTITTTTTAPKSTSFPSLFDSTPVQPTAARGTIPSTTPSFGNFGLASPPVQQPIRSNPQPSFGMGMSSTSSMDMTSPPALSGIGNPASTTNYQPNYFSPSPTATTTPAPPKPSTDAFGSLWSSALGKDTTKKSTSGGNVTMAQLAQQKSSSALWGATPAKPSQPSQQQGQGQGSGLDDLLF